MINLTLQSKQTLRILPSQIQWLNFLQLSTIELEAKVQQELEENPLLDIADSFTETSTDTLPNTSEPIKEYMDWDEFRHDDITDYKTEIDHLPTHCAVSNLPVKQESSWYDGLIEQLSHLSISKRQVVISEYIIGSLDTNGFCAYDIEELTDDISFANNLFVTTQEVEECLAIVQQLEPKGLACYNLQAYLLFQLQQKVLIDDSLRLAIKIVSQHLDDLANHNYERIMKYCHIGESQLKYIIPQILSLKTQPLHCQDTNIWDTKATIIPDYILSYENEAIEIHLNTTKIPPLKINKSYLDSFTRQTDKPTQQFIQAKVASANWLIEAIQQRESTMLKMIQALVEFQKDYFMSGDIAQLKPMILKDIAQCINMDISTVSRVTSGKYIQTPFGIIHLKSLFSEGIKTNGGHEVSNKQIQEFIAHLIDKEDKNYPLSDSQLVAKLTEKGFFIARRTVAKYRDHLAIQAAPLRRKL